MNTGNFKVHQWLINQHPNIVAQYIQYDNTTPFQPLQFQCAVNDLEKTESTHVKSAAIVCYWVRYDQGGKLVVLPFGLVKDVAVNSIIGFPTLRK